MAKYRNKRKKYDGLDPEQSQYLDHEDDHNISYNGNPITDNTKTKTSTNYGKYAQLGIGAYNAYEGAQSGPGTNGQKVGNGVNGAINSIAGAVTPWYSLASVASNIGKGFTHQQTITDPTNGQTVTQSNTRTNQALADTFTPAHETVINDFSSGNAGKGVLDTFTGGVYNTLDNFFNKTNQKKFDQAKLDTETYNKQQFDNQTKQQSNYQKQQQDYINQQIQLGLANNQSNTNNINPITGQPNVARYGGKMKFSMGGDLTRYSGLDHSEGGIPLGDSNEVENGETRGIPNTASQDYIYSDKLRVPNKKYTFAKASKLIENKFSKRDNDKLSDEQKQREINGLMEAQELVRSNMMDNAYKKAYGGSININPANKGKFNATEERTGETTEELTHSNNPLTRKRAIFAQNASRWNHGYGGIIKYENGGNSDLQQINPITPTLEGYQPNYPDQLPTTLTVDTSTPEQPKGNNFDYNNLYQTGNFLGSAYDIYRGLKGGAPVNYDRVNPNLVDYSASRDINRRDIKEGFNGTRNDLKNVNNPAQYLNLITQVANNRDKTLADSNTKSIEAQNNTNAGIINQSKYFNASTQAAESNARQQEKDVASNTLASGLYNAGDQFSQTSRDNKMYKSQTEAEKLIRTGRFTYVRDYKGNLKGIKNTQTGEVTPLG